MKNVLTLMLIVCISTFTFAQKVDLDRSYTKVLFKNLPTKPLGMEFKTFSVETRLSAAIGKEVAAQEVIDKVEIEGFKRVAEASDLTVKLYVEDLQVTRTEVKNREEVDKDKNGNVTARRYFYWCEVDYNFVAKAELINNKTTKIIETQPLDIRANIYHYKSSEVSSYNAARDYYSLNRDMVLHGFVTGQMNVYYAKMKSNFSTSYGYPVVEENVLLWINGGKKHPEFEPYAVADNTMKQAFTALSPDASVDQAKVMFQPAIDYLNSLLVKYTADEKPDRKLRYSAYFNLGRIYLNLDMPDEAIKMGEALITNDYDTSDGKSLIKEATDLKAMFAKNNFASRHFDRAL